MRSRHAAPAILAVMLAAVLGATAVALAHTDVKSTSPAKATTAKTSLKRVTVTFAATIRRGTLRVAGPGGKLVSVSAGGRDPRNISRLLVGLESGLKPGSYKASWTMVAADGHDQKGSFTFRLKR